MEQYPQGREIQRDLNEDDVSLKKWSSSTFDESETNSSSGFECNICLDLVQEPVVTFCGHLYCWPCIYRWINDVSDENPDRRCPVCKANVSRKTLIPLYGRGQNTSNGKNSSFGPLIPQRPSSPRCTNRLDPRQHQRSPVYASRDMARVEIGGSRLHMVDPMIGMFGEVVRLFGNSETSLYAYPNSYRLAVGNSPRLRRHLMQADESLSRICFFLFCCVMLCLILF